MSCFVFTYIRNHVTFVSSEEWSREEYLVNGKISLFLLANLVLTPVVRADQRCSIQAGDLIEFQQANTFYAQLREGVEPKGEFETTKAYATRLASAKEENQTNQPVIIEGIYDPEKVTYDADREVFMVEAAAWDNTIEDVVPLFGYSSNSGIGMDTDSNYAVGLLREDIETGSYMASNAYGASTLVKRYESVTYSVFDLPTNSGAKPDFGATLLLDRQHTQWARGVGKQELLLPIPTDRAPEFRDNIRVGVLVSPKAPFFKEGTVKVPPTIRNPVEADLTTKAILADIECAILADQSGRVLTTILPGY